MMAKKTAAQIQRELERKYGVIPSPWWISLCSYGVTIDGVIPPVGTEILFECADTGIICGAGITCANGLMKFSAAYGNDPYGTRKTGKITGLQNNEAITLWSPEGIQYDYYPSIVYTGEFGAMAFISELETV